MLSLNNAGKFTWSRDASELQALIRAPLFDK